MYSALTKSDEDKTPFLIVSIETQIIFETMKVILQVFVFLLCLNVNALVKGVISIL